MFSQQSAESEKLMKEANSALDPNQVNNDELLQN